MVCISWYLKTVVQCVDILKYNPMITQGQLCRVPAAEWFSSVLQMVSVGFFQKCLVCSTFCLIEAVTNRLGAFTASVRS